MISDYGVCVLLFVSGYLAAKLLLPKFFLILIEMRAVKRNWQGIVIPSMAGLAFPFIIGLVMVPLQIAGLLEQKFYAYFLSIVLIAILGLFDDLWGDRGPKGIRGHFLYLLQYKRLTTGVVKAVGTGVVALGVVYYLKYGIVEWLLLILTVNAINLFDLRPGRAVKGTGFFLILSLIYTWPEYWLIAITAGILINYVHYDLQGKVMLGDTGSNSLGMITGLSMLQSPNNVKIIFIIFLAVLHALAERYSFSLIIERYSILRRIDQWGRIE